MSNDANALNCQEGTESTDQVLDTVELAFYLSSLSRMDRVLFNAAEALCRDFSLPPVRLEEDLLRQLEALLHNLREWCRDSESLGWVDLTVTVSPNFGIQSIAALESALFQAILESRQILSLPSVLDIARGHAFQLRGNIIEFQASENGPYVRVTRRSKPEHELSLYQAVGSRETLVPLRLPEDRTINFNEAGIATLFGDLADSVWKLLVARCDSTHSGKGTVVEQAVRWLTCTLDLSKFVPRAPVLDLDQGENYELLGDYPPILVRDLVTPNDNPAISVSLLNASIHLSGMRSTDHSGRGVFVFNVSVVSEDESFHGDLRVGITCGREFSGLRPIRAGEKVAINIRAKPDKTISLVITS